MQSAPPVSVKVKSSKLIAFIFLVVWTLDVALWGLVLPYIGADTAINLAIAAFYTGLAMWLYWTYIKLFQGQLDWDGSNWTAWDMNQTLLFNGAVGAALDAQWLIVLKSKSGLWLVLQERHHHAHDWLALRRAVFSKK